MQNFSNQPNLFTENQPSAHAPIYVDGAPINGYCGYLRPQDHADAVKRGDLCAAEVKANVVADFERDAAYCALHGGTPDLMVHVSTFTEIDGVIYMTYYANDATAAEDPNHQAARLAYCPKEAPEQKTVLELQRVGDLLCGKTVTALYDTVLLQKDDRELYLLWTAAVDGLYYRLYRTYDVKNHTLGEIGVNRLQVGAVTNDFSTTGICDALAANQIPQKRMFSDIGIMQKLSARMENGETYYYTGAYSGFLNFIIKSRDFITWEYVAAPDFVNFSMWENATYVLADRVYYFVRQTECQQGFLTAYDLLTHTWQKPTLIADCQSRADFVYDQGNLYLICAPKDRNGFGVVKVCTEDLSKSVPVLSADLKESLFYPYVRMQGDQAYISYTVDRKHIRLSHFSLRRYAEEVSHE